MAILCLFWLLAFLANVLAYLLVIVLFGTATFKVGMLPVFALAGVVALFVSLFLWTDKEEARRRKKEPRYSSLVFLVETYIIGAVFALVGAIFETGFAYTENAHYIFEAKHLLLLVFFWLCFMIVGTVGAVFRRIVTKKHPTGE